MMGFSRLHGAKIIIFLVLLFLLGCNYHFSLNEVKKKPKELKARKIHIDPFINRTPERKLENFLINELVYEFNTGDELEIVERKRAEAILSGEFIAYEATGIAYTRGEYTATGRVRIAIKAKLTDRRNVRRQLDKDSLSFAIPLKMFQEMEENLKYSFLQRPTWKALKV